MKDFFTYPYLLLFLFLFAGYQSQAQQAKANTPVQQNVSYYFTIINGRNNTFGYDIYADDKLKIHQATIPAMAGNEGFKTRDAATAIAKLAISKMKKGESLPTIRLEEMKKLKAL